MLLKLKSLKLKKSIKLVAFIMLSLILLTNGSFLFLINNKSNASTIQDNNFSKIDIEKIIPAVHASSIKSTPTIDEGIKTKDTKEFQPIKIKILMYHYIRGNVPATDPLGQRLSVSPENFERQMEELIKDKYTPILFQDLLDYIDNDKQLPLKPIIITFDDGYEDHYTEAYMILKKHNLKGSFAIITNFVGKKDYMTWDQIKELKNSGNEIDSHTVDHPDLAKSTETKIRNELVNSKATLDRTLSQDTKILIYPSGQYNEDVIKVAKESGYKLARTTKNGDIVDSKNIFELPAIRIVNDSKIN